MEQIKKIANFDTEGSDHSSNSDDTQKNAKTSRFKRSKYHSVSNELRATLIKLVTQQKLKIKPTAKNLGINYSTAKSILQIYHKEGRTDKKLMFRTVGEVSRPAQISEGKSVSKAPEQVASVIIKQSHQIPSNYSLKAEIPANKCVPPRHFKPDHLHIEPQLAKKVKKEVEEVQVDDDSEPITPEFNPIRSSSMRYQPMPNQNHDLGVGLFNGPRYPTHQNHSFNIANLEIYRYLQHQQQMLNSRIMLMSAQNPTLESRLLDSHVKQFPKFLPNTYPFNFSIKM